VNQIQQQFRITACERVYTFKPKTIDDPTTAAWNLGVLKLMSLSGTFMPFTSFLRFTGISKPIERWRLADINYVPGLFVPNSPGYRHGNVGTLTSGIHGIRPRFC
jgi:hypothetical protein